MFGAEILKAIDNSEQIIFICHRYPDADTLGSACALAEYCQKNNKNAKIFCSTEISKNLDFLNYKNFYQPQPDFAQAQALICLDCADEKQTGLPKEIFEKQREKIINIDHHQTNPDFGFLNLTTNASSACELICQIFFENKISLSDTQSTALLAGIVTDTGFFNNASTTSLSLKTAGELISYGANISLIFHQIIQKNNLQTLKLWGQVLSSIEFNSRYGIASVVLPKEKNFLTDIFEGLSNFLTKMHDAKIIAVIRENDNNEIKVSLRTTKENIDLSALAKKFGGGGHKKAAGFSLKGKLVKTSSGWTIF